MDLATFIYFYWMEYLNEKELNLKFFFIFIHKDLQFNGEKSHLVYNHHCFSDCVAVGSILLKSQLINIVFQGYYLTH